MANIKKTAVIYARYSSERQREESIDAQLRECKDFAKRNKINVIGEYCDYALTGTSDNRPQFQKMIKDSAKKQFNTVIVWKIDRFARNRYDSAHYKAILKKYGVRLISAKESIPDGPEGILLESLIEGYAEYYSANLGQNVKRGMYESALKNKTLGYSVFGLRENENKEFEPDPETAPAIKEIFTRYAAGHSPKDIMYDLNSRGYRSTRGSKLDYHTIPRIIRNKKYMGVYEFKDIYHENVIPPIVSKELWESANNVLEKHRRQPSSKMSENGYLLTGKLYCGHCESLMTADAGTNRLGKVYKYYICNNRRKHKCDKKRVSKEWIEELIVDELRRIVNNDSFINEIADAYIIWQDKQDLHREEKAIEKQIKKVETAIKNLLSFIEGGGSESVRQRLYELETQKKSLETALAKEKTKQPEISRNDIVYFLTGFKNGDINDYRWKECLINTFVNKIFLYDDKLILTLNYTGANNKVTKKLVENAAKTKKSLCSNLNTQGSQPVGTTFRV